jgi:hypothetical protein
VIGAERVVLELRFRYPRPIYIRESANLQAVFRPHALLPSRRGAWQSTRMGFADPFADPS